MSLKELKELEDQLQTYVCHSLVSATDNLFEKITLKSGEQVRAKVKEQELSRFVADLISRARLFGWEPQKEHDHIVVDDYSQKFLLLRKHLLGYNLNYDICPIDQHPKLVTDTDDRKKVLLFKYGSENSSKIEKYESLKADRKRLLKELNISWDSDSTYQIYDIFSSFAFIVARERNPVKTKQLIDLITQMEEMKYEMPSLFTECEMQEMFFYQPRSFLYLDSDDVPVLFSEIPEEKRSVIVEAARNINYSFSSDWTDKFDETFSQELQSRLYKGYGEVKKLGEVVKKALNQPMHLLSCPVNKRKGDYVQQNQFNRESFEKAFVIAMKETCDRYSIGKLHPRFEIPSQGEGSLAEVSLMEPDDTQIRHVSTGQRFRGSRGKIYVLCEGDSIDFIFPKGEFYDKLNEAITAYNGALAWMFYKPPTHYSVNVRDLCVRSPAFSNKFQSIILGGITQNLNRVRQG